MGPTDDFADSRRVSEIRRFDVLHQPARSDLTAIVELAALVCGTPMATINLITDVEQHQVAAHGFDAAICRREDSMCAAVLDHDTPVVVADASLDPRFRDNPFVTGVIGHVRFYASHKLTTLDGVDIGTLCVFDLKPRELTDAQVRSLATLAGRIVDVLELSLRSRQLTVSNERLATFAGRVSHDLKTPLTSIGLSLDMLREQMEEGDDSGDGRWLVERALKGSQRMASLIDQALGYARLGGSSEHQPVDLDHVLGEVLEDLSGVLAGVCVQTEALPNVHGDHIQLRTVLQNLIDNAVKYRSTERDLVVRVTAERVEGAWRIRVIDNGRGIPVADRERVLEPRVRLDDDHRGSGIGLDTCRLVVEAHHGAIGVAETPGGGTTVYVDLP